MRLVLDLSPEAAERLARMCAEAGEAPETVAASIVAAVLDDDAKAHSCPAGKLPPNQLKTIRTMRTIGLSPSEIARTMGLPVERVREALAARSGSPISRNG